jgi:DNA-3-methyladenine glycosylase II
MINNGRSRKLPFDPDEAITHLKAADAKLAVLIERAGPFTLRLDPSPSPFESLVESILYQQLHGKAAATIHRRVREYFGGDPTPELLLATPVVDNAQILKDKIGDCTRTVGVQIRFQ